MGCLRSAFQSDKDVGPLALPAFGVLQRQGVRRGRGLWLVLARRELGKHQPPLPVQPPSLKRHFHCVVQCVRLAARVDVVPFACLPLSKGCTHVLGLTYPSASAAESREG